MPDKDTRSIPSWPRNERPREKLLERGPEALSDAELLAIVFQTGGHGRTAVDLGRALLATYGDFRELSRRPVLELREHPGIGSARAAIIHAVFEIGRRHASLRIDAGDAIAGPEDVAHMYVPRMRDLPRERFIALLLDNAGRVIKEKVISEGSVNASIVHPREVFHAAVTELASAVILLHNHPSGVRTPSREDHAITKQLVEAGRLMDIPVRDHVIICGSSYVSFAENGWL
ncbi:MAG: DNA repair protein RadC [Ignavibacteriae bacterium]|nr:DNA repair protein RadC [Ignavibacteriota bacterium]